MLCPSYDSVGLFCTMTRGRSVGDWMIGRKGGNTVVCSAIGRRGTDMIFVNFFTRPEVLRPEFYPKKRVNSENGKFTTKQRNCFKITNLRQKQVNTLK